jgi:hypothetical protein
MKVVMAYLKYYPRIYLAELSETTKTLIRIANIWTKTLRPPEYEAEVLSLSHNV